MLWREWLARAVTRLEEHLFGNCRRAWPERAVKAGQQLAKFVFCGVLVAYPVHIPFTRLLVDACSEQLGLGTDADSVADFVDTHLF